MKHITSNYFKLVEELKEKILENDLIEILNVFDKIKLFWNKHKLFIMNNLSNNKNYAIIGGMAYPHFDEKQYFLPIAHNKLLIIEEPISKMDEIIRIQDFNNLQNMLDILQKIVNIFLDSKDIILNNNIIIVPLKLYYGLNQDDIRRLSDKMVFSILSSMFEQDIQNDKDIEKISLEYTNFEKIDKLIYKTNRDILFLGTDYINFSISERIKKYYENCGMDFYNISKISSPIMMIKMTLYGYSAQLCDIINTCENINSDLYLFVEIPTFYFNILLENIFFSDKKMYDKYIQTIIAYYLQRYLLYTNFNSLNIDNFNKYYENINLLNIIKSDYKINNRQKNLTDMSLIKKCVEKRVNEFYNQDIGNKK